MIAQLVPDLVFIRYFARWDWVAFNFALIRIGFTPPPAARLHDTRSKFYENISRAHVLLVVMRVVYPNPRLGHHVDGVPGSFVFSDNISDWALLRASLTCAELSHHPSSPATSGRRP